MREAASPNHLVLSEEHKLFRNICPMLEYFSSPETNFPSLLKKKVLILILLDGVGEAFLEGYDFLLYRK